MRLQTASETISFLRELETRSASFYQSLAGKYAGQEAFFAGIAKENTKNIGNVQRTYFSIITDALEGCFAFDIDPDEYALPDPAPTGDYATDLAESLKLEEGIAKFYADAARQAKGLMADVPRVMERIVKQRVERAGIAARASGKRRPLKVHRSMFNAL